jgi:hypothetical protein
MIEALEVVFGGLPGSVEGGVLRPGKDLSLAGALHNTVVNLGKEALVAAEIGEETAPAQALVADHVRVIRG